MTPIEFIHLAAPTVRLPNGCEAFAVPCECGDASCNDCDDNGLRPALASEICPACGCPPDIACPSEAERAEDEDASRDHPRTRIKTMTVHVDDDCRIIVGDQGDVGVSIARQERDRQNVREGEKGRWKTVEDTLVDRSAVSDVACAMLKAIGATKIDLEF